MALSCIVSIHSISANMLVENRDFFILLCIRCLHYAGQRGNIAIMFGTEKLGLCAYLTVKKLYDMSSRFDRIPACDRRTDRRTNRRAIKTRTSFEYMQILVENKMCRLDL